MYPQLDNRMQCQLNEVNRVNNYQREKMSKKVNKYIAGFDYFDKTLLVLSANNSSFSSASFDTFIDASVGIT